MRTKLIACDVMREEIEALCGEMGLAPAAMDAEYLEMELHDRPEELLRPELARRVGALRDAPYDAILLGLGLCSNCVVGLGAPGIPLVLPRMHDCVTLFLGSRARYRAEHDREPGTYWYARGFLHRRPPKASQASAGSTLPDGMEHTGLAGGRGNGAEGGQAASDRESQYRKWVEDYGEDNAQYLMEEWLDAWVKNYKRAVYMSWDGNPDQATDRENIRQYAAGNKWAFADMPVDLGLLRGLLDGGWQKRPDDYLVVLPGQSIQASHDFDVVRAV